MFCAAVNISLGLEACQSEQGGRAECCSESNLKRRFFVGPVSERGGCGVIIVAHLPCRGHTDCFRARGSKRAAVPWLLRESAAHRSALFSLNV